MTTSVSNDDVSVLAVSSPQPLAATSSQDRERHRIRHTLASRFAFLVICVAIVTTTMAYGTVHYWAQGLFNLGGLTILILWVLDAWGLGTLRVSRNLLQLPLLGALVLGVVQLLPLRDMTNDAALALGLSNSLTFDPYATRLVIVQFATLLIYFSATLVFIDTPHRLHLMVRTIMIFGFLLAIFGLTQSFTSPTKVYWMRELNQSTAFGPFINRHHFAGYMELTIALPLGLLFAGVVEREKKLLFIFIAGLMGVALVMTASRGGIISLIAEIMFFVIMTAIFRKRGEYRHRRTSRLKAVGVRLGLAAALLVGLFIGVLTMGGEMSLNRLIVDSVNT